MKQNSIIIKPQKHRLARYHVFTAILLILIFDGSEVKMVLYNSFLKFDFAYIMVFFVAIFKEKLQKDSKILKNLHKVPNTKLPGV